MAHELEKEILKLLRDIVWQFGSQGLDGKCCGNLSAPEMRALRSVVDCPDCAMRHLAQALEFTKGGATRVVDRLEKKGMVRRVQSAEDGRVCCVHITPAGQQMLARVDAVAQQQLGQILDKMDPGMRQVLRTALAALVDAG